MPSPRPVALRFVSALLMVLGTGLAGEIPAPRLLAQPIAIAIRPSTDPPPAASLALWYNAPATNWLDALPIGNGRLGGMVFGRPDEERVQLNENTLWDGYPRETTNPEALKNLPEVRRLLFAGKNAEATALVEKLMGRPTRIKPYQPLGDLLLQFDTPYEVTGYRRELDLAQAVARVRYAAGDVQFQREVFASAPDGVIVIRLTASKPGQITTRLRLARSQDAETKAEAAADGTGRLRLRGQIERRPSVTAENRGMRFGADLLALPTGGTLRADATGLTIAGADAVTLLIAAATNYREMASAVWGPARAAAGASTEPGASIERDLARARAKTYDALRAAHQTDYRQFFDRVRLDLGTTDAAARPTNERLSAVQNGKDDPALVAIYFHLGRYLLISSSRPGQLPANLQGLWNDAMVPPWNSDYHTNINVQMNYWPAEVTNLSELHQPLFDYVRHLLVPSGGKTAKAHYGARGWVVHHLSDVWGFTTPADGVQGVWPMGAAWLAQHFWEHYAFTRDRAFLQRDAYPVMKGAAEFMLDFLVPDASVAPDGKDRGKDRLATNPSFSPENWFFMPDGYRSRFTYSATMDLEIIQDLFGNTIAAAKELGIDPEFQATLAKTLTRLPPLQISPATGRLQEWIEDYREAEPGHRHVSHLFALYPGRQITLRGTPALAAAAHKSLDDRLAHKGGQTGWSRAWMINFFARFEEGDRAYDSMLALLRDNTTSTLLDLHPPRIFQIDGNLAATAGVAEMLLQSHEELHLLPALPAKAVPTGSVTGLRARGGYTVDIAWRDGRLREATIAASFAAPVRVRVAGAKEMTVTPAVTISRVEDDVIAFDAKAGERYTIRPTR